MSAIAKWFDRPHRWVLVLFMFLTYKAGVACLAVGAPESALKVFEVSRDGMLFALGLIGVIKKGPDMLKAATGKASKK